MTMERAAIFISALFAWHVLYAAPTEHSVSPSRQFIIYGADAALRGAVSDLAERTKADFLVLLRQRDNWTVPIVLNLQLQQANLPEVPPADLRFSQTGFGLKLQLDLTLSERLDSSLIERELLRAILLEMIYRKESHLAPGTVFVEPPDWLLDGVLALVQMLTDRRDGPGRLAQYIDHLPDASNEPLANLKAQFPFLVADAEGSWEFNLRRLRDFQTYQLLNFAESERRLDELLSVKISQASKPAKVATLDDLAKRKISPGEKMALSQLNRDLLVFIAQANPVLRPIAREYEQIIALLARGKRRGVAKHLSHLDATRKQLAARMSDIDDYMNWFEATQMKNGSGNFADYLKAVDQSQSSASKRHDPLSVYLDALEDQVEN